MAAPKGTRPPGGSRKGIPNRVTADIKAMIEGALNRVGGEDYLARQAEENPKAFMALVGRMLPLQVTGKDGNELIPPTAADPQRVALAILNVLSAAKKPAGEAGEGGTASDGAE